jgi:hypothetical protein
MCSCLCALRVLYSFFFFTERSYCGRDNSTGREILSTCHRQATSNSMSHIQEYRVMFFVTHTIDLLCQDCPMAIVVVHLTMPFAQIYGPLPPTTHSHDTALMRFRAFTWPFQAPCSEVALRWPFLDILGCVVCDVRSRSSQLRRVWLIAVNRAFTRRHAHEIWCFKVEFHVFVQFLGVYSATNPIQIHRWGKWLWDRICVGYLYGLDSVIVQSQ